MNHIMHYSNDCLMRRITLSIAELPYERFQALAAGHGRRSSELIREAFEEYLRPQYRPCAPQAGRNPRAPLIHRTLCRGRD